MTKDQIQKVRDGERVMILRFGSEDSYFQSFVGSVHAEMYERIGQTGYFSSVGGNDGPVFFSGRFAYDTFDDGCGLDYFYQVQVEVV